MIKEIKTYKNKLIKNPTLNKQNGIKILFKKLVWTINYEK